MNQCPHKRDPRYHSYLLLHCEDSETSSVRDLEEEMAPDLRLLTPRTMRNNHYCLNHPVDGDLSQQPKLTETSTFLSPLQHHYRCPSYFHRMLLCCGFTYTMCASQAHIHSPHHLSLTETRNSSKMRLREKPH
jgi:hypothetical protein